MFEQLWSDKRILEWLGDDKTAPGWYGALRGMQTVRDEYEAEIERLRAQLAATWQPVEPGTFIDCPLPKQPYDEITCDVIAVLPGAVSLERGAYMLAHARFDADHAFCHRNPAAKVWRPVAEPLSGNANKVAYELTDERLKISLLDMSGVVVWRATFFLGRNRRMCELVAADCEGDA